MLYIQSVILFSLISGEISRSIAFSPFPRRVQFRLPPTTKRHQGRVTLYSSNERKNNLSASAKERREEEKRRLDRKTDVVIGKTSAKPEAQDFQLNPKGTEEEWMRQASGLEQKVYRETEKGLGYLKMLQLEDASEAFDRVFELKPDAYLWQAGIAKFYLGDVEGAADIFARSADYYERKFYSPASEERIWRDACELKLASSMDNKKRKYEKENGGISSVIAQVPERGEDAEPLAAETRKVFRIARDLFAATLEGNHVAEVLARAKLRSICGGTPDDKPQFDPKMWKLSSWYYLGLHYDVIGDEEASRECMKNALRLSPSSGKADDIIHTLPLLHMARRDLFDDEEFEDKDDSITTVENTSDRARKTSSNGGINMSSDPVFIESLRTSISKMRFVDLQAALKSRGLKFYDSKDALKEKLFRSLIEDTELNEFQ